MTESRIPKGSNGAKPKLLVIAGPTAVGKSALAVRLAQMLNGEIVSCDSMQVYRGMNIGTAKVTKEEMKGVPHHLIDVLDPHEDCNVVRFQNMAERVVSDILSRGKLPILCGGTGFYTQALLYGIDFTEEPPHKVQSTLAPDDRDNLQLHQELAEIDPEAAEAIPVNNRKRVLRAIAFYELHHKRISEHNREQSLKKKDSPYNYRYFVLTDDRARLYRRIDERVDRMMQEGLPDEVIALLRSGVDPRGTAMQGIGYREMREFFAGRMTREEAVRVLKQSSRHYAKRQFTWYRREGDRVIWIDVGGGADPMEKILFHLRETDFL